MASFKLLGIAVKMGFSDTLLSQQHWQRPYPTSEFVFTMLEDTYPGYNPGDPFMQRRHVMGKLCKKAGVKKFGFHAIRHLTAVILYKEGKPLSMIQKILRHQQPSTTEKYLASLGFGMDQMREALEVLGNRGPAKVIPLARKEKNPLTSTSEG